MRDPQHTELSNPGRDDYWSCPACLADLQGCDGFCEGDAILAAERFRALLKQHMSEARL